MWHLILINHYPIALVFPYGNSGRYSIRSYWHQQSLDISISWHTVELKNFICAIVWWAASFCVFICRCWSMMGIGMYTGILTVTLWNICEPGTSWLTSKLKWNGTVINRCWPIRRVMVVVVILLYALITVDFAMNMSYTCPAFIDNGNSFWTIYLKLSGKAQAAFWAESITASMSTIITDLYMVRATLMVIIHISSSLFLLKIWCCWMVWGRRWLIVLPPILSLISATGKVPNLIYALHMSNIQYSV